VPCCIRLSGELFPWAVDPVLSIENEMNRPIGMD
jgi:hypothetical protein